MNAETSEQHGICLTIVLLKMKGVKNFKNPLKLLNVRLCRCLQR